MLARVPTTAPPRRRRRRGDQPLRVRRPARPRSPASFHLIDGIAHCISDGAGPRLLPLSEHFELIWATGWEERANDHLPLILGLPDDLPVLTFGGRARFGTAHWKLDALDEYAGDRPLAWIDDSLDESCHGGRRSARRRRSWSRPTPSRDSTRPTSTP